MCIRDSLTLEVNDTVLLLVAAADVANGDAAVAVAASGLLAVSYTHLDVYKRQGHSQLGIILLRRDAGHIGIIRKPG